MAQPERPSKLCGKKIVEGIQVNPKPRPELKHFEKPECTSTWEDLEIGKKTYISHNRKTMTEYGLKFGRKTTVTDS